MAWRVTITFPEMVGDAGNSLSHRVRNFGELLYRHFRDHGGGSMNLANVDEATSSLVVEDVRKRDLGRTILVLKRIAAKDFPERLPEITRTKMEG